MTGSPFVTENPSLGNAALRENALPVIRWQPAQWHAMVRRGGALILKRTLPQRHPPSRDTYESLIVSSHRLTNSATPGLPSVVGQTISPDSDGKGPPKAGELKY